MVFSPYLPMSLQSPISTLTSQASAPTMITTFASPGCVHLHDSSQPLITTCCAANSPPLDSPHQRRYRTRYRSRRNDGLLTIANQLSMASTADWYSRHWQTVDLAVAAPQYCWVMATVRRHVKSKLLSPLGWRRRAYEDRDRGCKSV